MANQVATAQQQQPTPENPVVKFKAQVANNEHEFKAALPAHIPVERFMRVVTTAVVNNPDLLTADRRSLFESATKAAQDGLLPDGRDGALVIYNTKVKGEGSRDVWVKKVQWMPMIAGILKKVRNSGELQSIGAHVAYENDEFTYELGDEEKIIHRPALDNRGRPRLVYAIAKTKDGGIYREIMTMQEVEKVRSVSRAKDKGPWVDWFDEMARKTVLRRLAKRLPMSSDLDDLIRRDDALYDLDGAREQQRASLAGAGTLSGKLDILAAPQTPAHDADTGEIIDANATGEGEQGAADESDQGNAAADQEAGGKPAEDKAPTSDQKPAKAADDFFAMGRTHHEKSGSRRAIPGELRGDDRAADREAWLKGFDSFTPDTAQG